MAKRTRREDAAWSDYAGQLATNLQRLRQERGLSQEYVAYHSGLTRYTYQKYEKGESKPGDGRRSSVQTALTSAIEPRRTAREIPRSASPASRNPPERLTVSTHFYKTYIQHLALCRMYVWTSSLESAKRRSDWAFT
ncbi:helix-turn-helix domain-containing protein [Microbacterium sp. Clip185]|uniref:helix-turn-helix domain-containing protein n=1 Tax=Microbacterium sp. Clip185 TaxID=3025663 RepID=UPI002366A6E4|nr:helix-turn-helix transcriptional regulator [Microbacterium sp. Clip185]WDG18179.1 helix-turn-helix transcriptional regulator [Microbacterium sp. Clip185]